jgi:UDP-N-acetylmuramoylalanine--D-glutamate ligase
MLTTLIIGYGSSGQASKTLAESEGHKIVVYDDHTIKNLKEQVSLDDLKHLTIDQAILSPGVPLQHPVCQLMKTRGVPIQGEADYALAKLPQRKIAITGTNGKTTVTYLCEHILKQAGYDAFACGNVSKDRALSSLVFTASDRAVLVVELSSFQLETCYQTGFEAGIVLNITPDHLDRYGSLQDYAASKLHLGSLCDRFFVFDQIQHDYPDLVPSNAILFSRDQATCWLDLQFPCFIDQLNAYSAYLILKSFAISDELFKQALKSFKKPEHRLETVHTVSGIEFINDSKATNIDATIQALRSLKKPLILLAGGVDKGHSYSAWAPYLEHVKLIVCFGSSQDLIFNQLSHLIPCIKKQTLVEAICYAYDAAQSGDSVLLSPGCSSFDQFIDYQDRGRQFKLNAMNLKPKEIFL